MSKASNISETMADPTAIQRVADGEVVMKSSRDPPINIQGNMDFRDLLPPPRPIGFEVPRSTIVENVSWETPVPGARAGTLKFPAKFSGKIATHVATKNTLAYYGAKFANQEMGTVHIPVPHQQRNYIYSDRYLTTHVMAPRPEGAGGASLERHNFCHTDTPHEDMKHSGYFVIGRFWDPEETKLELTGFQIPPGETLWIPAGVIHTNNYLKGSWNTMLAIDPPIEEVKLERDGEKFSFHFRYIRTSTWGAN